MPTHPSRLTLIEEYLEAAAHGHNQDAPLFGQSTVHGYAMTALTPDSIYFGVGAELFKEAGYFRGEHGVARDAVDSRV